MPFLYYMGVCPEPTYCPEPIIYYTLFLQYKDMWCSLSANGGEYVEIAHEVH